jgi:cytochrome c oxidase subunit 2
VFQQIYEVFLVLGTLVGVVVVAYMLYNAYAYRREVDYEGDVKRPELGELPSGGGGGRKLFLSLTLSAVIVVSLIAWTYGTLLYVEGGAAAAGPGERALDVDVEGYQFGWEFTYPNGTTSNTLRVPEDRAVRLHVTSRDVFHNFGVPGLRVKTDAIPGHTTQTWLLAEEPGEYTAHCYELCGAGHSFMTAPVVVMERTEWQAWYGNTTGP